MIHDDKKHDSTKLNTFLSREKNLGDYIPFTGIYDDCCLTRDGEITRSWQLRGRFFETDDDENLNIRNEQLNTFLKNITSAQVSLYVHRVRRDTVESMSADYGSEFGNEFADKYMNLIARQNLVRTDLFMTLVYRPYINRAAKIAAKAAKRTTEQIKADLTKSIETVKEIGAKIESSLSRYEPRLLGSYFENGKEFNTQLSFFNFLLTFEWRKIRVHKSMSGIPAMVYDYIGNAHILAGERTIEVETPTAKHYAQAIELKEYNSYTEVGMLDELLYPKDVLPFNFIETQSFSFMAKYDAKEYLKRQRNQLRGSEDGALSQVEALEDAIDGLQNGDFAVGEYHYTLLVIGDDVAQCRANTQAAASQLQDVGFLPVISKAANIGAYYAQLPGNFKYRPRTANLTSTNFSMLAPLNNFPRGKRINNPWGDAVMPLLTPSNQVVYFNFHDSPTNHDNYGDKLLGNTMMIGKSGSGKTTLLTAFLTFLQKYRFDRNGNPVPFSSLYFDKDRGAEIAIRAMGGGYLALESGVPTGFNPFALKNTPENRVFLINLVCLLLTQGGHSVSTADTIKLSHAIKTVMGMPKEMRRLGVLLQNITKGTEKEERENSIHDRLAQWVGNGTYAWVFDQSNDDLLDFDKYPIFGIDGTAFLDDKISRAPIAMYLLYRMEQIIDGRRFVYFMDEFWKWLEDVVFEDFTKNKQLTIRKQNGFGVFATQQPDIVTENDNASALVGQTATLILLPNPTAKRKDYIEGLSLTEMEYEAVKSLNEDSRMFLVKQTGFDDKGNVRSYLASFNLAGEEFKDSIRILSGSTDNIPLLHVALAEKGEDPKDWIPRYLEMVRQGVKIAA